MKIISFNIGIKIDNSRLVGQYLQAQNADIICLQEAMRPLEAGVEPLYRSAETIYEFLKADYPYHFFAPEWVADRHIRLGAKEDRLFGGLVEQGKLVLSKYPIIHGYNYFYQKDYEFDCDRTNFYAGDDHGRALQLCELEVNGQIIRIANVHGIYSADKLDSDRSLAQSDFILKRLAAKKSPLVLVGDFNLLPNTRSIAVIGNIYSNINNFFNIPATIPDGRTIDYIFLSPEFKAKSLKVEITDISDHYPLILEVADL